MGYRKTEVCEPIIAAHRHHCFVPPEVWEVDAATVCGVCQAKNSHLISVLLQNTPIDVQVPVPVDIPKAPVISIEAHKDQRQRLCYECGSVQIQQRKWDKGMLECSECRSKKKAAS